MRTTAVSVIAAVIGLGLLMAGPAAAETLVDQPPGPSGVGLRSDQASESGEAFDDFAVPAAVHWRIEGIQVFGKAPASRPRTFNVRILRGTGGNFPLDIPSTRVFSERVTVPGGPDYLIPIEPAALLDHVNAFEPGQYWISVQAVSAGGEDDWYWLTGPDTPGTAPAYMQGEPPPVEHAEPGLAFHLIGAATQVIKANAFGAGAIVSNPPGISCPGTCVAEFHRGTPLTFTASALKVSSKFTEWGFRNTGFMGPSNELVPIRIPSPCGGTGACTFTVDQDTQVGAVFDPIDEVTVLRVVRDRDVGRGRLLVWAPGGGVLSMISEGLRSYFPGTVSAGLVRIPLIPSRKIAGTLRRKGRATVSARVDFRAAEASSPGTTRLAVTLVRGTGRHGGSR